jgi:hypothetical protein
MKLQYFFGWILASGSLVLFPELSLAHGGDGGHGFGGGSFLGHGFSGRGFSGRGDHGRFGDPGFRGWDHGFRDFDGDFTDFGFYGLGYPNYYAYDYPYYYSYPYYNYTLNLSFDKSGADGRSAAGKVTSVVQSKLSERGYYQGPI